MVEEKWEVDAERLTLDDLILLEEAGEGRMKMRELRDLIARLVTNKTAEEIGKLPLVELRTRIDELGEAISEMMRLPKSNDTPS